MSGHVVSLCISLCRAAWRASEGCVTSQSDMTVSRKQTFWSKGPHCLESLGGH